MISKDVRFPISEYYQQKEEQQKEEQGQTPTQPSKIVEFPKYFKDEYYETMRENSQYKSKDWYLSFALEKYAKAVKDLYCSTLMCLNNLVYQPVEMPNYVVSSSKCEFKDLETNLPILNQLAKNLEEAEAKLIDSLSINKTSISARCNKSKTINELRNCAAKAWLMYDNLCYDKFFHSVVDFNTRNATKDMSVERNIALISVGHYKAENYVKTKIKNYFSTTARRTPFLDKHGKSVKLYTDVNAEAMFFNLMTFFNGYNYQENETNIIELQQKVTQVDAKKVIEFYKNYGDVKNVYKRVFVLINKIYQGQKELDFLDYEYLEKTLEKRDVYQQAKIYLGMVAELHKLSQKEEYAFLNKDCKHFKEKLTEAINLIEPIYIMQNQEKQKKLENFKKNKSNIMSNGM